MRAGGSSGSRRRESYSLGYAHGEQARLARRSAAEWARFFLPHLRPGMRLLDVGCGPGSITLDLAGAVAPGGVVGVDVERRQVARARSFAATRDAGAVTFVAGDAYALPFADASFDAVFANTVLMHLAEPVRALREFRRVLGPGGVAGVRDVDHWVVAPTTPLLDEYLDLFLRVRAHNGGAFHRARYARGWLREAGFERSDGMADCMVAATSEATAEIAATNVAWLEEPAFRGVALAQGWADEERLAAMGDELRAWGERPDGFWGVVYCAAIGRVRGGR